MAKILFVVTSHGTLGNTGKRTGLWLEELAAPWYAVSDAGHSAVLASPKGGAAPVDPGSNADETSAARRFRDDSEALYRLDHTLPLDEVQWQDFDAVFLPGGHGVMWDLPEDKTLAQMIGKMYDAGRIVAAVCHGPAGLLNARRKDGKAIVAGRRMACFTDAEEDAAGLTTTVPFLLASKLRALGAQLSDAPNFEPHAVRDGHLISGQNPASSEVTAQLMLAALN
jgi:putative intracellular protease/amidase